jgi:phosphoenolpyruvate---glycerone phosphotransferase subunit DhaL
MSEQIGYQEVVAMLRKAAELIEGGQKWLSELDSIAGDGDHGTTMLRAAKVLSKTVEENLGEDIKGLFKAVSWNLLGVDGGATGPLFGTLFGGMSEALEEGNVVSAVMASKMFETGLASVERLTKARVGDKTMMDALVPAIRAFRESAEEGKGVFMALKSASEAAEKGAESTKTMVARYGRAKNVGEKTLGHQDPGATSIALLFRGFHEGILKKG